MFKSFQDCFTAFQAKGFWVSRLDLSQATLTQLQLGEHYEAKKLIYSNKEKLAWPFLHPRECKNYDEMKQKLQLKSLVFATVHLPV